MGRWRYASLILSRVTSIYKSLLVPPSHPPTFGPGLFTLRHFSAIPSRVSVHSAELDSRSHDFDLNYELGANEDEDTAKIPVKAYFLSTRLALCLQIFWRN